MIMKNLQKYSKTPVYAVFGTALLCSVYGINWFQKLAICSPFFVESLLITLGMAETFNKKTAVWATLYCLALNMAFYWTTLKWVHAFSFAGIFCSVYGSIQIFSSLKSRVVLPVRVFASLAFGILIDAIIMLPWEVYTFSGAKFWSVLYRSFLYKFSYAVLISLGALLVYSFKSRDQVMRHNVKKKSLIKT